MSARQVVGLTVVLLAAGGVPADPPPAQPPRLAQLVALPEDLKWVDPPPGLPPGAKVAVLDGDPAKAGGLFTLRLRAPGGYTVPPHWHSADENITVLDGSLGLGTGDTFDKDRVRYLPAGAFARMPKGERHYAITKGTTEIQVHGVGPFDITYVDPKDDPRKAGGPKK